MNRINRQTFVVLNIVLALGVIFMTLLDGAVARRTGAAAKLFQAVAAIFLIGSLLYSVVTQIFLAMKRLHDIGWSSWLVLLYLLFSPFAVVLALLPGQRLSNRYGQSPAPGTDWQALQWWQDFMGRSDMTIDDED